jgi:uncharacterized protein YyaL (SSP411 family)
MMKTIYIALIALFAAPQWHTRLEEAKQVAAREHRHILLNFSGSDWCGPCILLRKEVFDDPEFSAMADSGLVLVNADFPRMKKNQLPKEQQAANDRVADIYNPKGIFPLTLLLTADGKELKRWEGNPGLKSTPFCQQVRTLLTANDR